MVKKLNQVNNFRAQSMFITWASRLIKCTLSSTLSRDYEINIPGDEVVGLLIHLDGEKNTLSTRLLCLIEKVQPIKDHYKL